MCSGPNGFASCPDRSKLSTTSRRIRTSTAAVGRAAPAPQRGLVVIVRGVPFAAVFGRDLKSLRELQHMVDSSARAGRSDTDHLCCLDSRTRDRDRGRLRPVTSVALAETGTLRNRHAVMHAARTPMLMT